MFQRTLAAFALLFVASCSTAMVATAATAADTILYVSTTGSNANPCTLAKPCRSIQYAISKTPPGGELHVLDSGFYGNNATVNKSMTINGNGYTVTLGAPITVNSAGATVALRRLAINGQGSTARGIVIAAAGKVHIERCTVYGHTDTGIYAQNADALSVTDTTSRDNGGDGLYVNASSTATLMVDNSHFENNGGSGVVTGQILGLISRSEAAGNALEGFAFSAGTMNVTSSSAVQNAGGGIFVNSTGGLALVDVVSRGNVTGLVVGAGSTARISSSTFVNNATGIGNSGTVETRGNNTIRGNTANTAGNALSAIGGL
jgi:Right handed beta helix region